MIEPASDPTAQGGPCRSRLARGSGSYEVTAKIGEGGMGEVWRAHDTQLGRDVALKILPEAFASDPDRLARFQREAQVLASLNHPNIAQILGIETAEGTRALVLELVEGPTLADRIAHGAIPLEEALPIAKQIAEALEAAHEAGVIHRDLKPANIKVRADGTVKVLDFGLAKALDPTPTGDPSQSPTLTAAATQMGVIMGTAAYMSPEQARGKPVDKRTDIWAFGCVLYEMLTGQRAFQGEDVSLTLASVMKSDVKVTTLPDDLPASVRTVLRRCLEKDASQRIRDIGDVRLGMEGAFETTVQAAVATPQARGFRQTLPLAAGTLVLGALVTGLAVWSLSRPTAPPLTRFTVALPTGLDPGGAQMRVAISPDGRTLAYSDRGQLYRRDLAQLEWQPIPGTDNAVDPMFSPDGQWLAFEDDEGLKRVPVGGGPAVTIVEGTIRGASWGPDGTIVFAHPFTGLFQVPPQGGVPEPLTTLEEGKALIWPLARYPAARRCSRFGRRELLRTTTR